MSKERLLQLLKFWKDKAKWWYDMEIHAAWVDNGKGGCHNCDLQYKLANSKVEILEQLISEYK